MHRILRAVIVSCCPSMGGLKWRLARRSWYCFVTMIFWVNLVKRAVQDYVRKMSGVNIVNESQGIKEINVLDEQTYPVW